MIKKNKFSTTTVNSKYQLLGGFIPFLGPSAELKIHSESSAYSAIYAYHHPTSCKKSVNENDRIPRKLGYTPKES